MFGLTALGLARIQFGFTMSSHIIFPAITIGLASYLVALEGLWLWKKDTTYRDLYRFWSHTRKDSVPRRPSHSLTRSR
jgi:cytochrome d ubiquinol oxidase subunit I